MTTLLKVQSSLFEDAGQSSVLAQQFVERWQAQHEDARVISRDLATENIPHLDQTRLGALMTSEAERTPEQQEMVAFADKQIAEVQEADVLVLGIPMYNFSIPSVLKAWMDYVARAGVTFQYTAQGPEGLLKDKKAYVFITRGGFYGDDHAQTALVRQYLGFVGITDVEIIHAEGLNIGDETRDKSLAAANDRIAELLAA
ncbi:FMN-dependent NADH-azoreductase [Marinobacter lipolyticus]|uniref:FMN-dependent NADH-azoreductase n=1 Tax=Marinobacter lipolyticus TaxID=209639 RepID=UPI003A949D14